MWCAASIGYACAATLRAYEQLAHPNRMTRNTLSRFRSESCNHFGTSQRGNGGGWLFAWRQRGQQHRRRRSDLRNRALKRVSGRVRRLLYAGNLANILPRCCFNLFGSGRRFKTTESCDVSTHGSKLAAPSRFSEGLGLCGSKQMELPAGTQRRSRRRRRDWVVLTGVWMIEKAPMRGERHSFSAASLRPRDGRGFPSAEQPTSD